MAEKQLQKLIFLVVQPDLVQRGLQQVMAPVQRGVSKVQGRGDIGAAAPGESADAGQKFAGGKGLGEIIIGSGVQPSHPVGDLRLGR